MKGILIDPYTKTIYEVDYQPSLKTIYGLICVDCITATAFGPNDDVCYVDDEGLLKEGIPVFAVKGYPNPLAGRGLVVGTGANGDDADAETSLEWARENVTFPTMVTTGEFTPMKQLDSENGFIIHMGGPILGPPRP